jgi:hypothetical protein
MTEQDFKTAIKETDIFKGKAIYSKNIMMKYRASFMHNYYMQAVKFGVEYIKQNPSIPREEIAIIKEIIEKR